LRSISNKKHRDPGNKYRPIHYGGTLKQYKHALITKTEQHIRNQLDVIEESIESNHFWENWNKLNKPHHEELAIQNSYKAI
jgi:GTPase involved in cell partitioning and DNA repair